MWFPVLFTIHILLCNGIWCYELPSHWVDPHDLQNYKRRSKTKMEPVGSGDLSLLVPSEVNENCVCDTPANDDIHMYYRRIVNIIVSSLNTPKSDTDGYILKLNTIVDYSQYDILKKFGEVEVYDDGLMRELDGVLSDVLSKAAKPSGGDILFSYADWLAPIIQSHEFIIGIFSLVSLYVTFHLTKTGFSVRVALPVLGFIVLLLSFVWTWYDIVEEEEIQLKADLLKYGMPPECNYQEISWFQRVFGNIETDCFKHVRAHHKSINKSVWKSVTPQRVIAKMVDQTVGSGITQLFFNFFNQLPWPLNWLAVPFLLLFILLFLVFVGILITNQRLKIGIMRLFTFEIGGSPQPVYVTRSRGNRRYVEEIESPQLPQIKSSEEKRSRKNNEKSSTASSESSASESENNISDRGVKQRLKSRHSGTKRILNAETNAANTNQKHVPANQITEEDGSGDTNCRLDKSENEATNCTSEKSTEQKNLILD